MNSSRKYSMKQIFFHLRCFHEKIDSLFSSSFFFCIDKISL